MKFARANFQGELLIYIIFSKTKEKKNYTYTIIHPPRRRENSKNFSSTANNFRLAFRQHAPYQFLIRRQTFCLNRFASFKSHLRNADRLMLASLPEKQNKKLATCYRACFAFIRRTLRTTFSYHVRKAVYV